MSDFAADVINISKIKEGFHVGDELAATNLDVIIQLKLTHMINAAGSQIINAWETIGIKYLTLNWSENPSQNLFDSKDEIANRIVLFIDESASKGEGLLVHSVRGQNRVSLVVLIYLMKKYKWNLIKSLEFLRSKKKDIDIPKYFLNQLTLFEQRMIKKGEEMTNIAWTEDTTKDPEEKLMINTFLNGLPNNPMLKDNQLSVSKRHINWSDNNPYKKEPLSSFNPAKDLFNQKEIKPVTAHKRLHPLKSCVKKPNVLNENEDPYYLQAKQDQLKFNGISGSIDSFNLKNCQSKNQTKIPSIAESVQLSANEYLINYSKHYEEKKNDIRPNNYIISSASIPQNSIIRSNQLSKMEESSLSLNNNANDRNIAIIKTSAEATKQKNLMSNTLPPKNNEHAKDENDKKIVITNNFEHIVNNNINNYYIQSTLGEMSQTMNKMSNLGNTNFSSTTTANSKITNQNHNDNPIHFNNFVSSMKISSSEKQFNPIQLNKGEFSQTSINNNDIGNLKGKDTLMSNNNANSTSNINSRFTGLNNLNTNKIPKNNENQKSSKNTMLNNQQSFLSGPNQLNQGGINNMNEKTFKVIDYSNNNSNFNSGNYMPITKDIQSQFINNNKNKNINQMGQHPNQHQQQEPEPVNSINFQQMKPLNNYNPTLNKKNNNSTGALFNRQQNKGPVKVSNELYGRKPSTPNQITSITYINKDKNPMTLNNYGVIHRSNSKSKDNTLATTINRPLTANQKDHRDYQFNQTNKPSIPKPSNLASSINNTNLMKRLPSPQLHSNSMLNRAQKPPQEKYRPPTPIMKSPNIPMGFIKRNGIPKKY